MQAVGTEDTGPERVVRRLLHRSGYRYTLHAKHLPGRPDILFPRRKKAIFVNGCFWHCHGCKKGQPPKSRLEYWGPKLKANCERDCIKRAQLEALGWSVMTVWQCETREPASLARRLAAFIDGQRRRRQPR